MRYQTKFDVMKRTFKNVVMHLPSFISYERINDFYAFRVILDFPLSEKQAFLHAGRRQGCIYWKLGKSKASNLT